MQRKLTIVIFASELFPFAKSGGLADQVAGVAKALSRRGHRVFVVIPYWRTQIGKAAVSLGVEMTGKSVAMSIGDRTISAKLFKSLLPGSEATVILVDVPEFFDRAELYVEHNRDYADNAIRFIAFSRLGLEAVRTLGIPPDVVHFNDWQTGLGSAVFDAEYRGRPGFEHARTVFTIQNLRYQGIFPAQAMSLTGSNWEHFNWREMEYHGQLNLMKTGIVYSDHVTTVSPTYAREIQTPEYGEGLDGLLVERREVLHGILNGIDPEIWNPLVDSYIKENYSVANWRIGKGACKADLQQQLGLGVQADPGESLAGGRSNRPERTAGPQNHGRF